MTGRSLVYRHILGYRLAMNLLYRGGYRRRFEHILARVPAGTRSLCDLCFGDTYVAEWCRSRDIVWTGFDLNEGFYRRAARLGFAARRADIMTTDLPDADVYLMAGSLYHFHEAVPLLLERIFAHTTRFLLSEPVQNLSSRGGLVGWLARRGANPGDGPAEFRYTEDSLLNSLRLAQAKMGFRMSVVSRERDLLLEITR